jgi:potassium-dependent mechanosensitive channel
MQRLAKRHLSVHRLRTAQHVRILVLLAVLLFVPAVCFGASEPKAPDARKASAPSVPAPSPSPVIAEADVARRAMEVSNLLRTLSAKLAPNPEIETIRKDLPKASEATAVELAETRKVLQDQPLLETLQAMQQLWQAMQHQRTVWLNVLTARATELQEAQAQLADLQKTWALTRTAAQASKAPKPLLQQIDATVSALGAAQEPFQAQRTAVLNFQSQVAEELTRCATALAQIAQVQHTSVEGILTRNRPPIWSAELWEQAQKTLPSRVPEIAAASWQDIRLYLSNPSEGMPLHAGIFVVLALIFCAARRRLDQWAASGEGTSSAAMVFERPYAAALIGPMLVAAGPLWAAPPTVRLLLEVVAFAPMIRLTRLRVHPMLVPGLYTLWILLAADAVRQVFTGAVLVGQAILMLEALAGIIMIRILHLTHLQRSSVQSAMTSGTRTIELLSGLILVLLSVGLVAGVFGYMRLAILMVPGVLAGGALALTLYAVLRVSSGAVAFALHVWPLRLLQMVHHHRAVLERRIYRLMVWVAIFTWFVRYLDYVGLLQPAFSVGSSILAIRLERGSINISVEDLFAFFLTVWVAYLLSAFIRFVLREDVYPRMRIAPGLSYAISSLLNYVIIALGIVVGMGLLGLNLARVTVLAGAFGVGIGFGLQSIVNNFVSGLILLFERPIHVGDTVQVGDLLGEVRRIGIRSSIVHTYQGSDIIVPNAQLISEPVTNWTLSDQLRRIDLPVGINYGAEPKKVIEVMETVAKAHRGVLPYPPPQAYFVSYGDSSINFELRVWTDQFQKWFQVRSEVAVALYDAVYAAGMTFPFPQREVRLVGDTDTGNDSSGPKVDKA